MSVNMPELRRPGIAASATGGSGRCAARRRPRGIVISGAVILTLSPAQVNHVSQKRTARLTTRGPSSDAVELMLVLCTSVAPPYAVLVARALAPLLDHGRAQLRVRPRNAARLNRGLRHPPHDLY
jgi:hypothetical protein